MKKELLLDSKLKQVAQITSPTGVGPTGRLEPTGPAGPAGATGATGDTG